MCEKFVKVSIFNNNRLSSMDFCLIYLFSKKCQEKIINVDNGMI